MNDRDNSSLRNLLKKEKVIVAPGVFSPISAIIAEKTGFKTVYFSGGALSNTLGLPDLGVITLSELSYEVQRITNVIHIPLIIDADTGFGETVNVERTVKQLERIGAAALHIEDQVMPKRCGHLEGKLIVPVEEMVKKLIAANEARNKMLIIARTDARSVEGLDSSIERARIYIKAGADIIFPEALQSEEEFKEFAAKVKAPLLANMTEFGKTPYIAAHRFAELGYKIVIFPMTAFRATLKTCSDVYAELSKKGTQAGILSELMPREEIYNLIDYYKYQQADSVTLNKAKQIILQRKG
ncbi:MAG: methylisocitrate lyase [Conexivisphaerales archaeon]